MESRNVFVLMKLDSVCVLSFWRDLLTSLWPFAMGGSAVMCCRAFGKDLLYLSCISRTLSVMSFAFRPCRKSFRPTWKTMSLTWPGFSNLGMFSAASLAVYRSTFLTFTPGLSCCGLILLPLESVMKTIVSSCVFSVVVAVVMDGIVVFAAVVVAVV